MKEPTLLTLFVRRQREDKSFGPAIAQAVAMRWLRERLMDADVYQIVLDALAQEHASATDKTDAILDGIARALTHEPRL